MWRSATSSDAGARRPGRRTWLGGIGLVAALVGVASPVHAQVFLTRDEALRLAFPEPARIERQTAYLQERDLEEIERAAGVDPGGRVVTYYVGHGASGPLGAAYFDVHRVRTMAEVLMIVVDPDGNVSRIEILRFAEPREYLAPDGWLEQFEGRGLSEDLIAGDAVVAITGATLTSRAVTGAVRRTLALNARLEPLARPDGRETGTDSP